MIRSPNTCEYEEFRKTVQLLQSLLVLVAGELLT